MTFGSEVEPEVKNSIKKSSLTLCSDIGSASKILSIYTPSEYSNFDLSCIY